MFWHIYVVCFQPDLPWSIDHFPSRCHQVVTLTFGMMFFLYLFGPVDGWFLTGPNSKMETVAAGNKSRLEQNAGFFCGKMLGKSPVF
jgi:hypothetical protein